MGKAQHKKSKKLSVKKTSTPLHDVECSLPSFKNISIVSKKETAKHFLTSQYSKTSKLKIEKRNSKLCKKNYVIIRKRYPCNRKKYADMPITRFSSVSVKSTNRDSFNVNSAIPGKVDKYVSSNIEVSTIDCSYGNFYSLELESNLSSGNDNSEIRYFSGTKGNGIRNVSKRKTTSKRAKEQRLIGTTDEMMISPLLIEKDLKLYDVSIKDTKVIDELQLKKIGDKMSDDDTYAFANYEIIHDCPSSQVLKNKCVKNDAVNSKLAQRIYTKSALRNKKFKKSSSKNGRCFSTNLANAIDHGNVSNISYEHDGKGCVKTAVSVSDTNSRESGMKSVHSNLNSPKFETRNLSSNESMRICVRKLKCCGKLQGNNSSDVVVALESNSTMNMERFKKSTKPSLWDMSLVKNKNSSKTDAYISHVPFKGETLKNPCTNSSELLKKPMPQRSSKCKTTSNESIKNLSRKMIKSRTWNELQNPEKTSFYPFTSTLFGSPEIISHNSPPLFEELSPLNRKQVDNSNSNCSIDDILLSKVKVGRLYGKAAKIHRRTEASRMWESFRKHAKHIPNTNPNDQVYNSSGSESTRDLTESVLFKSPCSLANIDIDDIVKMRYEFIKKNACKIGDGKKKELKKRKNRISKDWLKSERIKEMKQHFAEVSEWSIYLEKAKEIPRRHIFL